MEVSKRFPIQGYADVPIGDESLKVKYRYPTRAQVQAMGDESNTHGYAMAICKYCVEDIQGLTSEGQPIKTAKSEDGTLTDDYVVMLYNNGIAFKIAAFYTEHVGPTALDKKKLSSSPDVLRKESESQSVSEAQGSSETA